MKKFFVLLLVATLLLALPLTAWAAGSASLSGPKTVRAGDTITLTFKAGGGIYGGNGSISFDSSQLTLQKYSGSLGGSWAVEFSGNNFVFYDNSMASPIDGSKTIFKATFKVSASLKPGTEIKVSAKGVTVSDGNTDTNIGTRTYKVTLAEPLSGNANLKSLTVSNADISPQFAPGTTSYAASVPFATSKLDVKAEAEHPGASVKIGKTGLTAGGTTDVTVTVTAEDGTKKVYHIKTKRAQDPNYVESKVNTLNTLSAGGFPLSPAFDPERAAYAVYLPYETEGLVLDAEKTDKKSKVALPEITGIPVGETTYEIPVTAEDGTVRTYTLTVFRANVFEPGVQPTEPPTEPATEPETEPTTVPTTQPTVEPTEPAAAEKPDGTADISLWMLALLVIMGFCAGCITILVIPQARRK